MSFNSDGERVSEELSDVLSSIPGLYESQGLSNSYKSLCEYLIEITYGQKKLNKSRFKQLLTDVADKDGGYIGNKTIQDILGIDFRRKLSEQIDSIDYNRILPEHIQSLGIVGIQVTQVKAKVTELV